MNKASLLKLYILVIIPILALIIVSTQKVSSVQSAVATHLVISEVQIAGATADDEFVELYNPTDSSVDLSGYRLTRKTSAGTQATLVSSMSGSIASHGFFLVTNPGYTGSVLSDLQYSATTSAIAANNTIVLYSDAGVTVTDKVGMGTATDNEATTTAVPAANQSIERKALSTSTTASMQSGGADEFAGNGEDTNNNGNDFILKDVSQPQNSLSALEPVPAPTPSASPSASAIGSPSASSSATPSSTPSPSSSSSLNLVCTNKPFTIKAVFLTLTFNMPSCKLVKS